MYRCATRAPRVTRAGTYGPGRAPLRGCSMYQGSPLFPIFRSLTRSLHRHSSIAQGHHHTIHPATLGLPRTRPPLTSAINTLLAIRYSSILSTCSKLVYIGKFLKVNTEQANFNKTVCKKKQPKLVRPKFLSCDFVYMFFYPNYYLFVGVISLQQEITFRIF